MWLLPREIKNALNKTNRKYGVKGQYGVKGWNPLQVQGSALRSGTKFRRCTY